MKLQKAYTEVKLVFSVKILKVGTPGIITVNALKIEQFDFTMQ